MHNTQANRQLERYRQRLTTAISSSLEKARLVRRSLHQTLRRCPQLTDQPEPETFPPNATMLGQRTLLLSQSWRLASCGSRGHSPGHGASVAAPFGAALSVVPAQFGIVHSRIAAWDIGGPRHSLFRGGNESLELLISDQILATEQPGIPNTTQVRAFTTRAYTGMYTSAQNSPTQKRVYKRGVLRYKCGVDGTQN